jgi:molybdopterin molybdotransferase
VLPTLQRFSGINANYQSTIQKHLTHDYVVNNVRCQFLKAIITNENVTILPHQDSSMLDSFALANALVYIENGNYELAKGNKIAVYLL